MPDLSVADALIIHCLCLSATLAVAYYVLRRTKQHGPANVGFWFWASAIGYFLVNPVVALVSGHYDLYERALRRTEGADRVLWIALTINLGTIAFFTTYALLRKRSTEPEARLCDEHHRFGFVDWVVIVGSLAVGIYSIVVYRIPVDHGAEGAHYFASDFTAYEYRANSLALYPLALLFTVKRYRLLGVAALGGYLTLRLFDPWERASLIYPVLAIVCILWVERRARSQGNGAGARQSARWRRLVLVLAAAAFGLFLFKRGHVAVGETPRYNPYADREVVAAFLTSAEIAMLPALQLESYQHDAAGYNYGTVLLARLVFGPLPRKYFPHKDEYAQTIAIDRHYRRVAGEELLPLGRKSTLFGAFYSYGGVLGVLIGMTFLAWIAKRLDRLLTPSKRYFQRAQGAVWMSMVWMMFAGHVFGGITRVFMTGIPFVVHVALLWATRSTRSGRRLLGPSRPPAGAAKPLAADSHARNGAA